MSLFDPWTVARPAPLSMGFSRQEHWSGLPFRSPGDLPDPRIDQASRPGDQASASAGRFFHHQRHLGSLVGLFWTQKPRCDDGKAGPRSGWVKTVPVSPLALCSPRLSQYSCCDPEAGAGPSAEAQLSPTTKMPIISASTPPFHVG